ncbi:MAG: hypothetical protein GY875_09040 [Gammaproteobacteria bacterium]|nr:hypothetical protein [Gammaproteobacteria bacterium]
MSVFLFLNVYKVTLELQDANQSVSAYPGNTGRKDNRGKDMTRKGSTKAQYKISKEPMSLLSHIFPEMSPNK